jgi:SCP-2 sterol transfer family
MEQSQNEAASDSEASDSIEPALENLVTRMGHRDGTSQHHSIRLQLSGPHGGTWSIETVEGQPRLVRGHGSRTPSVEVHAEAESIRRVLDGTVDGRTAFLAGGILVRGDVASLEHLSASLGTHTASGG